MATERIESLISKEALAQFDQLNEKVNASVATFERLVAEAAQVNKVLGGAKTFKQIVDGTKELDKAEAELNKTRAELAKAQEKLKAAYDKEAKALSELDKAKQKLADSTSKEAKELASVNVQRQENARNLKTEAQLQNAVAGSIEFARVKIKDLTNQRDILNITTDAGKRKQAELNAEIDKYNKFITDNTDKQEKQRRNVGNYSGALQVLEQALQDVKKKMDDYNNSGKQNDQIMEALQKEYTLLDQLVKNQATGFATASREIRENQKALIQLEQAGLQGTEAYRKLAKETGELKDQVGDLQTKTKNLGSDTFVFDGLIQAAQGLAGIYGVAQGAAALFGDENEELQKTFVKLQAVMTIIQSLQAVATALQKENAAVLLLQDIRVKALAIGQRLYTFAVGESVGAMKAFRLALAASGIGLLLLLIPAIAKGMDTFSKKAEDAGKRTKALGEINEKAADSFAEQKVKLESLIARIKDSTTTDTQKKRILAEVNKEYGDNIGKLKSVNDLEQFAIDQAPKLLQYYSLKAKAAAAYSLQIDAMKEALKAQQKAESGDVGVVDFLKAAATFDVFNEDVKEDVKDFQKQADVYGNIFQDLNKQIEDFKQNNGIKDDTDKDLAAQQLKAQTDALDVLKIKLQQRAGVLQDTLSDERKSYAQRIAAAKEFTANQIQQANLDAQKARLKQDITPGELAVIEAGRVKTIADARRAGNKQVEDLNKQSAERQRKAELDILTTRLNDEIKANDRIVENDKKGYSERLDAAYEAYQLRAALLNEQLKEELKNETLTTEERKALAEKAASEIQQITIDYGAKQLELVQANEEKITEAIGRERQARRDGLSLSQSEDILSLNNAFKNGLINLKQYNEQRKQLEEEQNLATLEAQKKDAQEEVSKTQARYSLLLSMRGAQDEKTIKAGQDLLAAKQALADKEVAISDYVTQKQIENEEKLNEAKKQLAQDAFDLVQTLVLAGFDNQKNAIQDQINQSEEKKQKDIEAVNASIATEQEKADKIAIINARAQAQKDALERRQRQIDLERARFEKAAALVKVIVDTAQKVAAIKAQVALLLSNPLTAAYAGIAAAQIPIAIASGAIAATSILAQPLPKFATGTDDAPGGFSIVGDGGKKELVVTPDGELIETPARPTVMNVPKHSIIFPDARQVLEQGIAAGLLNTAPSLVDHGKYYREMTEKLSGEIRTLGNRLMSKTENHWHPRKDGWEKVKAHGNNRSHIINDKW